ncbi:hypothetical protein Tco_0130165, partial [Tanacetum coccineum]
TFPLVPPPALAYSNVQNLSMLSDLTSMPLASEPSAQEDPSVNSVHGFGSSSAPSMSVSSKLSSGHSIIKSARICPLTDVLGRYWMSCSSSSKLYLSSLPVTSEFDSICFIG